MPINQDQFWSSNAKVCVTYPINGNVAIIIGDYQQKYVVLKAMRRSCGISKIVLMKKLKSKVYVSFQISLYMYLTVTGCYLEIVHELTWTVKLNFLSSMSTKKIV